MRNNQLNKIKMYETVKSVIQKHQATWSNTPAFVEAYDAFVAKLTGLIALTGEHQNSTKGTTALKREVLEKTVTQALTLGNVLGALATKIGDTKLLMRNVYTKSEWMKGGTLLRTNRFKQLLSDVQAHEQEISEYGVDPAFIQEFEASVQQYEELSKQTRTSIVSRKNTTKVLSELFKEIDEILVSQVGRILLVFNQADPEFVSTFKNARIIVDHKGKSNQTSRKDAPIEPDDGDDPNSDFN